MKGVAEAMLLLLIVGALVMFLALQVIDPVLGYQPQSADLQYSNTTETVHGNQRKELEQLQEQLKIEQEQLNRAREDLEAERSALNTQLEELNSQKMALAEEKKMLEEHRNLLVIEEARLEETRVNLEAESKRLAILKGAIAAEKVALDAEWDRVYKERVQIKLLRTTFFLMAFFLGFITVSLNAPPLTRWIRTRRGKPQGKKILRPTLKAYLRKVNPNHKRASTYEKADKAFTLTGVDTYGPPGGRA